MKVLLLICLLGMMAKLCGAHPKGLLILTNDDMDEEKPTSQTFSRPYSPLPPMFLPPYFQNQGFSLPPPPSPPLHFAQANPFPQLQLGDIDERFLANFLAQLKPLLFPWMSKPSSTTVPTSTSPSESGEPTTETV